MDAVIHSGGGVQFRVRTGSAEARYKSTCPCSPVCMAEESGRTRVADTVQAAEKPQAEPAGTDWAVVMAIYKDQDAAQRRATTSLKAPPSKLPCILPRVARASIWSFSNRA